MYIVKFELDVLAVEKVARADVVIEADRVTKSRWDRPSALPRAATLVEVGLAESVALTLRSALDAELANADQLAQALRHTQEYLGDEVLPPSDGWSWYDALRAHNLHRTRY